MAQMQPHTDPVCGMIVTPDTAAARVAYQELTFYFCSDGCRREFEAHPARDAGHVRTEAGAAPPPSSVGDVPLEQHEPPFTKSGRMVSPKFGAAGSGGAEYERLPEAHAEKPDNRDAR